MWKIHTKWTQKSKDDEAKTNKNWQNMKLLLRLQATTLAVVRKAIKKNNPKTQYLYKLRKIWMSKWVPLIEKVGKHYCSHYSMCYWGQLKLCIHLTIATVSVSVQAMFEVCLQSFYVWPVACFTLSVLTSHSSKSSAWPVGEARLCSICRVVTITG